MKKNTAIIFRIAGIIFFIVNMLSVLEMFNVNISTFMYIITEDSRGWSIFFIVTALLYTTYFLFALFSTGTAALFGGKNGFTQSVWNCSVYSLVALSAYTSMEIITGIEQEEQFFLVQSIIMQLFFSIIMLVCLKEEKTFFWKNILPVDENSRLSLKVYAIMLALIEISSFFIAHHILGE